MDGTPHSINNNLTNTLNTKIHCKIHMHPYLDRTAVRILMKLLQLFQYFIYYLQNLLTFEISTSAAAIVTSVICSFLFILSFGEYTFVTQGWKNYFAQLLTLIFVFSSS